VDFEAEGVVQMTVQLQGYRKVRRLMR
jgi:hypothetical protein